MKKTIFSLMIGTVVALSSCSKSDEASNLPQSGDQLATFSIEAPAATRASVTGLSRYIVEAYEGENLATTPVRVESATGSLTLELKKNTKYTFVFWADFGTANTAITTSGDYYDATSLQDVKVSPAAYARIATPAYCLAVSFNSKDFEANKAIVLKNATAQLNFTEAAGLATASNSLTVKYSSGGKLNVATGKVTEIGVEIPPRTYANIGKIAKDGILATDYILAPLGEKRLFDLKMTFNSEPEKTVTAIPLQQNYKTSVKGEYSNMYSSVFTVSDKVNDYENNPDVEFPEKAKVGDFYYKDGTWSSTYTADAQNPCIGIVFWVDPTNGKKGKIVGLKEPEVNWNGGTNVAGTLKWGTNNATTNAIDEENGVTNMTTIKAFDATFATYPAFAWAESQNIAGISWYLPATKELRQLYAAMSGLKWVASGAGAGEINDWRNGTMFNYNTYITARTTFNGKFTEAKGTLMDLTTCYWSSTEDNVDVARYVYFVDGGTYYGGKAADFYVRVVSAF